MPYKGITVSFQFPSTNICAYENDLWTTLGNHSSLMNGADHMLKDFVDNPHSHRAEESVSVFGQRI